MADLILLACIFLSSFVNMLSKSIETGSLVYFKNTKGPGSIDIIYKVHYTYNAEQKKIPVFYYRVLKPGKAYINSNIKII